MYRRVRSSRPERLSWRSLKRDGRPESRWKRTLHRIGSAIVLPVVGFFVGGFSEYRYLHRSLDSLPQPQEIYSGAPLSVEKIWRMGPLGFVYGVVLKKPAASS